MLTNWPYIGVIFLWNRRIGPEEANKTSEKVASEMFQNVMTLYYTKYSDLCACQEEFLYPGASKYVEGALAEARQEAGPETRKWTFTNNSRPVMSLYVCIGRARGTALHAFILCAARRLTWRMAAVAAAVAAGCEWTPEHVILDNVGEWACLCVWACARHSLACIHTMCGL